MFFLLFIAASFFIQLFTSAWYIISESSEKIKNPFKFKIICPLLYLADILLAVSFKGAFTDLFSIFLLCGFVSYFFGELLSLAIGKKKFLISGSFFSAGKILFIFSLFVFSKNIMKTAFSLTDIIVFSVLMILLLFILIKHRLFFGKLIYPVLVFGTADAVFLSKSLFCGISCLLSGAENDKSTAFILLFGGILIVLSDILYVYMIFFGRYTQRKAQLRAYIHYYGMMIFSCLALFYGGLK